MPSVTTSMRVDELTCTGVSGVHACVVACQWWYGWQGWFSDNTHKGMRCQCGDAYNWKNTQKRAPSPHTPLDTPLDTPTQYLPVCPV